MSRCHQIWNPTIRTWFFNVLKSADFRYPVFKIRSGKLLVFASQGFTMSIPNPKHQRLPWDDFLLDPKDDKPSWTFCGGLRTISAGATFLVHIVHPKLFLCFFEKSRQKWLSHNFFLSVFKNYGVKSIFRWTGLVCKFKIKQNISPNLTDFLKNMMSIKIKTVKS